LGLARIGRACHAGASDDGHPNEKLDRLPNRERPVIALRFGLDDSEPKT